MHQTTLGTEEKITSVSLDGHSLSLAHVEAVARHDAKVEFAKNARKQVQSSADSVRRLSESDTPVYGVNTGFGIFADKRIDPKQSSRLSRNLILSHAVGLGDSFPAEVVRAAMLIRANSLAHGHSGVRAEVVDTLIEMLNRGVCPSIPSQGSLGSSGDLAPLAHLGLVLSTSPEGSESEPSGHAWFEGQLLSGAAAMQAAGLSRLVLGPKEGLAITNGATFSTALLSLACFDAERLLLAAEIAASLALEALLGASAAFDQRLHAVRPHPGQVGVAKRLRMLLSESELLDTAGQVQDAYSLRCTPQIIGPAWDILAFAKNVASRELNSATDNPLLFGEEALSGGNFHGQVIGLAADYLKIALANVGGLSERRTFRLSAEHTNAGLPPMLVAKAKDAGLHSGLMMLQYSAASLALENQSLATPDSIHSLPTSAGQEDLNANSTTAGRHLLSVIFNLNRIIALELITASQALDLRLQLMPRAKPGVGTAAVHQAIRKHVPFYTEDHPMEAEIEILARLVTSGTLIRTAAQALAYNTATSDYP